MMNNREIVNYILSNNLKKDDVIKEIYNDENMEGCMYITNDGFRLYDDNGIVSLLRFADDNKSFFQIISEQEYEEEVEKKMKEEKIKYLKEELAKLEEIE